MENIFWRVCQKKTGGNICKFCVDKTISGEYVLDRPPKKPGGISSAVFVALVMNLCLHLKCIEASNLGLKHRSTSERDYISYLMIVGIFITLVIAGLMSFVFCLISLFKNAKGEKQCGKALHASECLATGTWGNNLNYVKKKKREDQSKAMIIHDETNTTNGYFDDSNSEDDVSFESLDKNLKDQFELEAICLITQIGISCNAFHEQVLAALWNTFNHDISLLVDKKRMCCSLSEGRLRGNN